MSAFYLGCPLWGQRSWVGNFFPAGTKPANFLASYALRLNTVEGNTTFYAVPDLTTIARWRDQTPPGFKFCLKVPQVISHRRRLRNCETELAQFTACLRALDDRRGPAFLQLPPTFTAKNLPHLESFLHAWPSDLSLAVEPRHADFFAGSAEAEFDALLTAFGAARCIFDTVALFSADASSDQTVRDAQDRKPRFPRRATRTAPFAFVRFVSHPSIEQNRAWLDDWARWAAHWLASGDDCYFFVHHPDDTFAPTVARLLHDMLGERVPLPPLPSCADARPTEPRQAALF